MPGRKAPERERREQILNAAMSVANARRLSGLTIREVARAAGLSTGLVLFHFKSRDGLIRALLNWLIHQNSMLQSTAMRRAHNSDDLAAVIHDECIRLANTRQRTELLFDYWVTGTRHPELRQVMRSTVRRYRQEFRAIAARALRGRRAGVRRLSPDAVSAAAVSFIYGCGMQAVIDPEHFDVHDVLAVVSALAAQPNAHTRSGRPTSPRAAGGPRPRRARRRA
jgi:AcrR family transcriptional regulator